MFLTVNKDVLTMLMTSLARDASALGSIEVEVEVEVQYVGWVVGFDSYILKPRLCILDAM